jgi:TonB family protein
MRRPIRFFFIASACLHLIFLISSGFIFIPSSGAPSPIKVSIISSDIKNKDLPTGKIESLPEPKRNEIPEKSKILSKFDSKAHNPEKGKKHSSKITAIPREKVAPPSPSINKSKVEEQATKPTTPKTKINALVKPNKKRDKKPSSREITTFSKEVAKRPNETEPKSVFKIDIKQREEKRHRLSAKTTDHLASNANKPPQPSGLSKAKGSEMETYASAASDQIIDMGDEAIISFNTRSFVYIDYFDSIRKQIEEQWAYPEEAIVNGWNGRVMLRFSIKDNGELISVSILKSTGHGQLDKQAKSAISLAAPFDPFPATLSKKKIHIVATFVYQPTFSFIR